MDKCAARSTARHVTTLLAACACALPCGVALAQPADVDPFHWGYAAAFGGGTYRLGDGTEAQIVRARFAVRLRETQTDEGRGPGVRLLLPVTIGIQNLDDDDLPPERPADRVEQVGFLPGVELEHEPGERWTVRTHAQLGWGKELQGTEGSARLASVGVRSRLRWDDAPGRPALINGLLWAGFDPDAGERRSMLRLTAAVELDIRVPRWEFRDQSMHLLPHVLADRFYRPPPALAFGDDEAEHLESEWQIGVAAGREQGFSLLGFEFETVGIAYRFSEHSDGIRFYLNSVF
jgi:hypothetical protein